jgi:hypothetical protein
LAADLDFIQTSFGLSEEQTQALFELPPYGTAVVRYGGCPKPFLLEVPHFEITKKVTDSELKDQMSTFYTELDRHIRKTVPPLVTKSTAEAGTVMNMPAASAALLFFLGKYPFTTVSGLAQASGFKSSAQINKSLEWLIQNEFVRKDVHVSGANGKGIG